MFKFIEGGNFFDGVKCFFEQNLIQYKGLLVDFLEIGSFEGRSSLWMLENILTHTNATLTCIDMWQYPPEPFYENAYSNFLYNMVVGNFIHKTTFYKMISNEALKILSIKDKKYDFIYIDGAHHSPHPLEDAVLSFPLLKVGGTLAFDDYLWDIDTSIKIFRELQININKLI